MISIINFRVSDFHFIWLHWMLIKIKCCYVTKGFI